MQTINFYIGTLDKDTLKRKVTDAQVIAVLNSCFENYTVEKVMGVYTMQQGSARGEIITEDTFKVTLLTQTDWHTDKINNICKFIKNMLNQECIPVEIYNTVDIKFI